MKIENAVPHVGALVTGLDVRRMSDGQWQTLYQTWLDRHVLIVRGQELSKADFLAYSRRFGCLKPHMIKRTRDPDNPEITLMGVTSMARARSSMASRFQATAATRCLPPCTRLTTRCPSA
jgi:alpha-ketoglutarate-dependent taurine dioxygenase